MAVDERLEHLVSVAAAFVAGKTAPLETATGMYAMIPWDEAPELLQTPLATLSAVISETDHIPLGKDRELWHVEVRAKEDRKHDEAQAWAAPLVLQACQQIIAATAVS